MKRLTKAKSTVALAPPPSSWLLALLISISSAWADPAGIEFFESKIRPLLSSNCYECHSHRENKRKGGLHLDYRDGLLIGGDTGPAISPGKPDQSLLIKAVSYADEDLQMPPDNKKLNPRQIEDLRSWIELGAPDPRSAPETPAAAPKKDPADHWAFKPIQNPAIPINTNSAWPQNPVDHFILARLEAQGISPSKPADRRTLLRRAWFDLIGLPPSQEDIDAFAADSSPNAFAQVVDRLLSSSHYGERWARYWLDVARYADTKGYVFTSERRFPFSYTYRDYVIRSFNEDLPFDRFLVEQIAADRLDLGEDKRPLAALGFLTLGRRFLNNQHDIIDDRIDVVTRGTMGLTVTCARCHDHKYDPIPTEDYYSLYGIFASAEEPGENPLLGNQALPDSYADYLAEKQRRESRRDDYRREHEEKIREKIRGQVGDYLLAAHDAEQETDDDKKEALVRSRQLDPTLAARWRNRLVKWRDENHPVFAPWFEFASLEQQEFAAKASAISARLSGTLSASPAANPLVAEALATPVPGSLEEVAARYTALFASVSQQGTETASPDHEPLSAILRGPDSPLNLNPGELARLFPTAIEQKLVSLQREVDKLESTHDGVPPRAMALQDRATPHTPKVFIRGNSRNQGAEVPRQFLQLLEGPHRQPYTHGSGRLEMAQAIASPTNPLTARVIVNRVWARHFGKPLVQTQSDFGVRAEPPTHPELLDYLAARFIGEGWSIKKLHRLLLLSSTYQQSSEHNPAPAAVDPSNTLLWRMNRQRLDFEGMRDTLLAISGQLDRTIGGRPVEITEPPFSSRRSVYGFIERQNLPALFRTFDLASPDTTSPGRFSTTVPQQALFLMNSPFAMNLARRFAHRPEIEQANSQREKIIRLYQFAYQRDPAAEEIDWALAFLQKPATGLPSKETASAGDSGDSDELSPLEQYAQILLVANELFFVD